LIGIADDGLVRGTTLGKETLNEWLGQVKSPTSPSIIPDIETLEFENKSIVVIQVSEYPVKPVNTKGKYFKRIAASNHHLTLLEITNLYLQSLQLSWDSYAAPHETLDSLSIGKIEKFIDQVNQSGRFSLDNDPLFALEKLKYIAGSQPAWAAMLLFAENPLRHHIHIGRFKGAATIIDDHQITDTLFEAAEHAMKVILSHTTVSFGFDGSMQRKERFAYPLPALREVLLNAIVHRDYANSSDIQIKVFDDRISFFSPGKLYGGLSIADLATDHYQSRLRNKLIAEAFYLTKNIEKYGSGFIRIRKELKAYPELTLRVEEIGDGVLVTFVRSEGVNEGVNEGVSLLYDTIQKKPGVRIPELSAHLNVPAKTLERWMKQLRKEKRITFKGSAKTGGYYTSNADEKN
jgi:ATP-dependent DNA helicase RecG